MFSWRAALPAMVVTAQLGGLPGCRTTDACSQDGDCLPGRVCNAGHCGSRNAAVDGGQPDAGHPNTVLARTAAAMAPGTWQGMTALQQDQQLGHGALTGSILNGNNTMPWNPVNRSVEIIAADNATLRHVRYREDTNSFELVNAAPMLGDGSGNDHTTVNPGNGDVYHRLGTTFSGTVRVYRLGVLDTAFSALPTVNATEQVSIGTCYWAGSLVGAGSQGALLLYNGGNANNTATDGQLLGFSPDTNTWFFNQTSVTPFLASAATYNSVMEYSAPRNVAVFGGGNALENRLFRLDADGQVHALAGLPAGTAVGIFEGILVPEPVGGNFLLLSRGEFWELNPQAQGTWTQLGAPPAAVGQPGTTPVVAVSLPAHGVVAFITQPGSTGGTIHLYRHQ